MPDVSALAFDWDGAAKYRAAGIAWPVGYPDDLRTLFSPSDGTGIHEAVKDLLSSASHSVVLNMYGFDDDDANDILLAKMLHPEVYVQMSLDRSQAGGVHEKVLLAKWPNNAVGTSIAIGQSVRHAISHLKVLIVDGLFILSGSTNWSLSGEEQQDNEFSLHRNAVLAAQYRSILDVNHSEMLRQMSARTATAGGNP